MYSVKKQILQAIAALFLLPAVTSCGSRTVQTHDTIPFVKEALTDTSASVLGMLRAFDSRRTEGAIAVVGETYKAVTLADRLVASDGFDNVDGRSLPDGLPDFSGETVAVYMDEVNSPYSAMMTGDGEMQLREVSVRTALMALDTVVRATPYDRDNLRWKAPAKVIVLASPLMSEFGFYDIDTLCRMTGKDVPLISPVHAMMKQAFASHDGALNIGVWSDGTMLGSGVFRYVFDRMLTPEKAGSTLTELCPDTDTTGYAGESFLRFLEMYRNAGAGKKLDVLLVDDGEVDVLQLDEMLQEIRKAETFAMMNYDNMLSRDFRIVDMTGAVKTECYRLMRERNLFTHYVAFPQVSFYNTVKDEEHPDDAPFVMMELNRRYLKKDTRQFLESNSTAYTEYVSNQY